MSDCMSFEYGNVARVLDDLETVDTIPVGALGTIYLALDRLRASRAPRDHIDAAERISVTVHKWQHARRIADRAIEENARDQLKSLSTTWREMASLGSPTID